MQLSGAVAMPVPLRDLSGLSLGIELFVSTVAMGAVGHWADRHFGTDPSLTLVGFALGAVSGFRSLFRWAARASQNDPSTKDG
jgi:F0F1-type ATP synthase assembly protein I